MQNTQIKLPAAGKILKKFRLRRASYSKKIACGGQVTQKNSPVASKLLKRIRLRRANYSKKLPAASNTQNISPAAQAKYSKKSPVAGKILKRFCLRRAKHSKDFACGGQNTQKISPAAGKINNIKNFINNFYHLKL